MQGANSDHGVSQEEEELQAMLRRCAHSVSEKISTRHRQLLRALKFRITKEAGEVNGCGAYTVLVHFYKCHIKRPKIYSVVEIHSSREIRVDLGRFFETC